MKKEILIALLVITLAACAQTNTADIQNTAVAIVQTGVALTQTAMPTATLPPPTFTPTALLTSTPPATPTPAPPIVPVLTPDAIQVEKWKEYQTELAKTVLSSNPERGSGPVAYEDALCEWDILGQSDQKVYVYAICAKAEDGGDYGGPAVIYLEADGSIQNVKVAGFKGSFYDLGLFPADVQQKLCYYFFAPSPDILPCSYYSRIDVLRTHLDYRQIHPEEPPLVVLSATPIP